MSIGNIQTPIFYSIYNVKLKPGESSEKKNVPHS